MPERLPLDPDRRAFVMAMLGRMPESIVQPLLNDPAIRGELALPVEESVILFDERFAHADLFLALRSAANGAPVTLRSITGAIAIDRATLEPDGSAVLSVGEQGARFTAVGLLSDDCTVRARTLEAILAQEDLDAAGEATLRAEVASGPLEASQLRELEIRIDSTPKAFYRGLHEMTGEGVPFDVLVPTDRALFEQLLGVSPPASLAAYRDASLAQIAALDPIRRARQLALAAPLSAIDCGLAATGAAGLDDGERRHLARFLAGAADPLSRVAAVHLAAADVGDDELRALGTDLIRDLLDPEHPETNKSLAFLAAMLILTGTATARRLTLADWPIYARRLACYVHASLLVRTFGNGRMDGHAIARLVGDPMAPTYRLTELGDARDAPWGLWSAPAPERLHALVAARVVEAVHAIPEPERPPEWTELVDRALERISVRADAIVYMAPSPFDPFEDDWAGFSALEPEVVDEVMERMEAGTDHDAILNDLMRLVIAFDIEQGRREELAGHLPKFLVALPDETFAGAADMVLQLAARWALPELAEQVIDLSLPRASEGRLGNLGAGPRFSLLGAASHRSEEMWRRKAGEYLNGFACSLPTGAANANLIAALELIGDFAPGLRPAIQSARSFAILARNYVQPAGSAQLVDERSPEDT